MKGFFKQLIFLSFFSVLFISGSFILQNYLDTNNNRKSLFPILVYTDTEEQAYELITFLNHKEGVQTVTYQTPHELKQMLIIKYSLENVEEIIDDFTLPYQVELTVLPLKAEKLSLLILELSDLYPDFIIQYNQEAWQNIELKNRQLKWSLHIIQIFSLFIYLFIQSHLRILYIIQNKKFINAVVNSGISYRSLSLKNIINNLFFILFSTLIVLMINISLNYFDLVVIFFNDFPQHQTFFDFSIIILLILSNIFLVLVQKPVFSKNNYD